MTTVQLAIPDSEYAQFLRTLLARDGAHRVLLVAKPNLNVGGVVVIDGRGFENSVPFGSQTERFVVIVPNRADSLLKAWQTGVRHVVFERDSANTVQMAVMAAELRLPKVGCDASIPQPRSQSHEPRLQRSGDR